MSDYRFISRRAQCPSPALEAAIGRARNSVAEKTTGLGRRGRIERRSLLRTAGLRRRGRIERRSLLRTTGLLGVQELSVAHS